jgi:hypothetical protein
MAIFDAISDFVHELLGGTTSSDLSDLGADPHQLLDISSAHDVAGEADQFPTMGGSSVMEQINHAVGTASENYTSGMAIAEHAPHMASAGEQAQQFIDGVMHASPEQLAHTGQQLGGLNASEQIQNSIAESQDHLWDGNAAHEQIKAADSELIHAKSVEDAVRRLLG